MCSVGVGVGPTIRHRCGQTVEKYASMGSSMGQRPHFDRPISLNLCNLTYGVWRSSVHFTFQQSAVKPKLLYPRAQVGVSSLLKQRQTVLAWGWRLCGAGNWFDRWSQPPAVRLGGGPCQGQGRLLPGPRANHILASALAGGLSDCAGDNRRFECANGMPEDRASPARFQVFPSLPSR